MGVARCWMVTMLLPIAIVPVRASAGQVTNYEVVVAKSGADFTDPIAAMNSIIDATESKRYVVKVLPGVYTLNSQLLMKPYVDIVGSGEKSTVLAGTGDSCVLVGDANAELRHVTVRADGGGQNAFAICNHWAGGAMTHVTAIAQNASNVKAIVNDGGSVVLTNVTVSGTAPAGALLSGIENGCQWGVYCSVEIRGADVNVSCDACSTNNALYVSYLPTCSMRITDSSFVAVGGTWTGGLRLYQESIVHFDRSTVAAAGGANAYAIESNSNSIALVGASRVDGSIRVDPGANVKLT